LGSSLSLLQISKVNRSLDSINRISLPLNRLFAQMQVDAEVFRREAIRGIGSIHWNDAHWVARPIPTWIVEVLDAEVERASGLIQQLPEGQTKWAPWIREIDTEFDQIREKGSAVFAALERRDLAEASKLFPLWNASLEDWMKKLQWGIQLHEQGLRDRFTESQASVSQLRTGLEMILFVVIALSLLMLWLGERALRPLDELTRLVRSITERGLQRGDKESLPEIAMNRNDEVSALAREFHRMATQLLEWEKVVDGQKRSLADQNQLLKDKVDLQEKLKEIEHLAAVGRLSAQVAHEVRNPLHAIGLEAELALETATAVGNSSLKSALQAILASVDRLEKITENYLRLSRMGTGERLPGDLSEILEHALATYATSIEKARVRIDWKMESGEDGDRALPIRADTRNLEQAVGNLLQNALQTGANRIEFRLGSRLVDGKPRGYLQIEDNGPGVPEAARAKLFTPFSTTKAQGTGLGLSFVKKVAEEHGGEAKLVEATRLGGAAFEFSIPLSIEGERDVSESAVASAAMVDLQPPPFLSASALGNDRGVTG
jgi:signal transduction histidine kinase